MKLFSAFIISLLAATAFFTDAPTDRWFRAAELQEKSYATDKNRVRVKTVVKNIYRMRLI